MKIGIVSFSDPYKDKSAISGILYKLNLSLEQAGFETIWIKVYEPPLYKILSLAGRVVQKMIAKVICWDRTLIGTYLLSKTIDYNSVNQCDILVFPYNYSLLHRINTKKTIVYHSDCTFDLANGYYLKEMFAWNKKQAEIIELESLRKADYHLSSSQWRENSVINHYKIDKTKCHVLQYGPCIELEQTSKLSQSDGILHLLFIAVEWDRKGGEIAVETCNILNQRGITCVLHIVGIRKIPKSCKNNPAIDFVGYLNKNNAVENKRLMSILSLTDIMILPTKAECSAIVYSENSAYGNPIVTFDTGGAGDYVLNGVNGYRLKMGSKASDFASRIYEMLDDDELKRLSYGGKELYQTRLNWDIWSKWFKENLS